MPKDRRYTSTNVLQFGIIRDEAMKTFVKKVIRYEKGQALLLAIILLLVAGLIAAPLLAYMGTGILTGKVYDRRTAELYAADAGVEDAVWKIQNQVDVPTGCSTDRTRSYNITDVNDKKVAYNITRANNVTLTYHVISVATGDSSGTRIDAYITGTVKYYPSVMDQLITIQQNITDVKQLEDDLAKLNITCPAECTSSGNCGVCGQAYDYADYDEIPAECRGCVAVYNFPSVAWPGADSLNSTYWQDVQNVTAYNSSTIDLNGKDMTFGPLKSLGTLTIKNSSQTPATLRLSGTFYISGDTNIAYSTPQSRAMTLDLNGNTIFVASKTSKYALAIGSDCTIKGPGIIIALGGIYYSPKAQVGGSSVPIFIMSVLGTTCLQPNAEVDGAVAGNVTVNLQSSQKPPFAYPVGGFGNLTFPRMVAGVTYGIASWEVNSL
jgi:Tfp pilus assembly protein PilX